MKPPAATSPAPNTWTSAALSMIACGLLFEVVYNACNWITTQRSDVGTWAFAWEQHIPFAPSMIVPYWTLNLFFVGSFFLCRDANELRMLRNRIAMAILVAAACFLLFPLKLVFPRPEVDGFFGLLFAALRSFDQPHNLAPSLHIALRTIIWPVYVPRTKGALNVALRVWFVLIGASTILVYQHQVMDIVTGWMLAIVCLYAFAEQDKSACAERGVRNARIGAYCAIGAACLATIAVALRPWGLILLWPAVSLTIVAAGYFRYGGAIFRKRRGRLPLASRILLVPVLAGHWLSLRYYARQCRAWDSVAPGVLIGRKLNDREAQRAVEEGVTAVVDLAAEFTEANSLLSLNYYGLPILDLTAPSMDQLHDAVKFIDRESRGGLVYIHCKAGYSRSAAVAGAYLLESGLAKTADDAIAQLRTARPSIVIRHEIERALRMYAKECAERLNLRPNLAVTPAPEQPAPLGR